MLGQAAQATISYLKLPQGNSCFPDDSFLLYLFYRILLNKESIFYFTFSVGLTKITWSQDQWYCKNSLFLIVLAGKICPMGAIAFYFTFSRLA